MRHHSGPLPDPDTLQRYDQLSPGAAERIIAMAESEIAHRQSMERKQLDNDVEINRVLAVAESERVSRICDSEILGQKIGGGVSALAIICSTIAAWNGYTYAAVALVSLPVLGMIQAITRSRKRSRVEEQIKNDEESEG